MSHQEVQRFRAIRAKNVCDTAHGRAEGLSGRVADRAEIIAAATSAYNCGSEQSAIPLFSTA